MNYQEIVNRIQDITNKHKMLADFGYGDLSDLKVRFENTSGNASVQADYPYLFLNPGVHGRNGGVVTYNFNMIVMDMAREEVSDQPYNNMLAIQSQCQQYIDDVIAYLHDGFKDNPDVIYTGVTYTPFNERFQDEVSGMTATLKIEVPQPINNCITPFELPCLSELAVFSNSTNTFPYTLDPDTGSFWRWETNTLETPAIGQFNDQYFSNAIPGDFEFYITSNVTFIEPAAGEVLPQPPVLKSLNSSFPDTTITCDSGNWPTAWTDYNSTIEYTAKYNITLNEPTNFGIFQFLDQPANESAIIQNAGGTLTIGYTPPGPALVLDAATTAAYTIRPDTAQSPVQWRDIILDTFNGLRENIQNYYRILADGSWTFVIEGTGHRVTDTGTFPNALNMFSQDLLVNFDDEPTTQEGWPTDPAIDEDFTFRLEWSDYQLARWDERNSYVTWRCSNEPAVEDEILIDTGMTIKAYYTPTI